MKKLIALFCFALWQINILASYYEDNFTKIALYRVDISFMCYDNTPDRLQKLCDENPEIFKFAINGGGYSWIKRKIVYSNEMNSCMFEYFMNHIEVHNDDVFITMGGNKLIGDMSIPLLLACKYINKESPEIRIKTFAKLQCMFNKFPYTLANPALNKFFVFSADGNSFQSSEPSMRWFISTDLHLTRELLANNFGGVKTALNTYGSSMANETMLGLWKSEERFSYNPQNFVDYVVQNDTGGMAVYVPVHDMLNDKEPIFSHLLSVPAQVADGNLVNDTVLRAMANLVGKKNLSIAQLQSWQQVFQDTVVKIGDYYKESNNVEYRGKLWESMQTFIRCGGAIDSKIEFQSEIADQCKVVAADVKKKARDVVVLNTVLLHKKKPEWMKNSWFMNRIKSYLIGTSAVDVLLQAYINSRQDQLKKNLAIWRTQNSSTPIINEVAKKTKKKIEEQSFSDLRNLPDNAATIMPDEESKGCELNECSQTNPDQIDSLIDQLLALLFSIGALQLPIVF